MDVHRRMRCSEIGATVCPISLYLDDVHPDWRGGAKLKPIVISCGNYIGSVSRSMKGKRIIAYFPKINVS